MTTSSLQSIQSALEAIKQRAEAATPGPWDAKTNPVANKRPVILTSGPETIAAFPQRITPGGKFLSSRDCRFIADSRTTVPKLVAALEAAVREAIWCSDNLESGREACETIINAIANTLKP